MGADNGSAAKRSYGTGSLSVKGTSYYGKWRVGDRQVMRKIGPVRERGTRDGLTKGQAEAKLRKMIAETAVVISPDERHDFAEVAERYIDHVKNVMDRKPTTVHDYRLIAQTHLNPYFGKKDIDRITPNDVAGYLERKARDGLKPKTISNHITFAHAVFRFAMSRGLTTTNPVAVVDRPRLPGANPDFRYLTLKDFAALVAAVPDDLLGPTDRALYVTAGMSGLRQGELVALRWRDVDADAGLIRVRRNFTRSQMGTPKSRRGSRAVPLADPVREALEAHRRVSHFLGPDDLVFAHPATGQPYDASRLRKRFYDAMRAAGLGELVGRDNGITFHSLRHTYGTRMAAAGTPMRTLQEWMGHRSIQTTEIYADFSPDDEFGRALTNRAFG